MNDELPDDVRALLVSERARPVPDPEALARIREAVASRLALAAGQPPPEASPRRGRWPSLRGLLVGVVAGVITGHLATRALQGPRERVVVRVVERVVRAPAEPIDGGDAPADAPTPSDTAPAHGDAGTPPSRPANPTPRVVSGLAAERALIERCSSALVRGDAIGALAAAREHARRFRDGVLVEEREAMTVQALRALGRSAEADARADVFLRRWPDSLHAGIVRGTSR